MVSGKKDLNSRPLFFSAGLLVLVLNATLYTADVMAQAIVDLEVSVHKTPDGVTLPGSGGTLTFTIYY